MGDQEGTPLHAVTVAVHAISRTFPFLLTLSRVPFVRVIALIVGNCIGVMVSGGSDLMRVKAQAMWGRLSLALPLYPHYFPLHTRP